MCCKESDSSKWRSAVSIPEDNSNVKVINLHTQLGKNTLINNIKGVVFIGAHWEELDDSIRVATKLNPDKAQIDMVDPEYWKDYPVNVSIDLAERVNSALKETTSRTSKQTRRLTSMMTLSHLRGGRSQKVLLRQQ